MHDDLSDALRRAADAAVTDRPAMAAGPVLLRIRRRRTARTTLHSGLAAAAVAAAVVVVTGVDAPPPAPGPAAWGLPGEVRLPGCGEPVPDDLADGTGPADRSSGPTLDLLLPTDVAVPPVGAGTTVDVLLTVGAEGFAGVAATAVPVLLLTQDDAVVAIADPGPPPVVGPEGGTAGASLRWPPLTVPVTSCADGAPLPDGEYELRAVHPYRAAVPHGDPSTRLDASQVLADGAPVTLATEPWTVRVNGLTTQGQADPQGEGGQGLDGVASCGAPAEELLAEDAAEDLGLDLTVDLPVPVRLGTTVGVATLASRAAPVDLTLSHLGLVLTRDGVVVGTAGPSGVPRAATVSADQPFLTGDGLVVRSCTGTAGEGPADEEPALEPGTYTAWPVAAVVLTADLAGVTWDGPAEIPPAVLRYVVAEPRPLEVHGGDVRTAETPATPYLPPTVMRATTDGTAWRVVGEELGRDAASGVRSALLADGLEVVWEQELGGQYWGAALTDGRRWVTAEVEAWTGGSAYSTVWTTEQKTTEQ